MSEVTMSLLSGLSHHVSVDVDLGFKLPHEEEVKKAPPVQQSMAEIHQTFAAPPVAQQQVEQVEQKVQEVAPAVQEAQQDVAQAPAPAPSQEAPSQEAAPHATVRSPSGAAHWNAAHPQYVEQFDQLTGGSCRNPMGELDLVWVADWQAAHGCDPDSCIGPKTISAARKAAKGAPEPEQEVKQAAEEAAPPAKQPVQPRSNPENVATLTAQYGSLLRQYQAGTLDKAAVIAMLVAYDKGLNGGTPSLEGAVMVQAMMTDLKDLHPQTSHGGNDVAPAQQGPIEPAPQEQKQQAPASQVAPQQQKAAGHNSEVFKKVYDGGDEEHGFQKCLVFVSAGDLTATPDVFLFFHGHGAQYGIDDKQAGKKGSASGSDVAGEAMQQARGKNVIAILPQGVVGGSVKHDKGSNKRSREGGHMKALAAGLPTFLGSVLNAVAGDLNLESLSPGHISIAGHSAGGYQGVHDALEGAGDLLDHISDITLMDSSYSSAHFSDAADWMFQGQPGKSLRIIGSPDQIKSGVHGGYFSKSAIEKRAGKGGYEVEHLSVKGDERDHKTKAVQHTQLKKDGAVHGDIIVLASNRGHHDIRDDVMDDAILSIGQGAAGNEHFAEHDIKNPGPQEAQSQQPQDAELAQSTEIVPVTVQDLEAHVEQVAPQVQQQEKKADGEQEQVQPEPEDGLVQQHLQTQVGQLEPNQGTELDEAQQAWLKNTKDATSCFSPDLKEKYDVCVAKAKAGTLCFPAKDEPAGKSSAAFKKFLKALYAEFGYKERRINNDITEHGGKKAYDIRKFLESQLADVPGQKAQLHHKASAAFVEMHAAAAADGVDLTILSSYRVPKNKKSSNPYAVASNSSHSYGLALDLKLSVDKDQAEDGDGLHVKEVTTGDVNNLMKYYKSSVTKWMLMNGARFGFYPYMNEPWHYEYNPEGMAKEIIAGAKAFKK
ncbi:MAG TPA: D-alanyl-D-alanine carboxypeptidase family protein [Kofleriaceae bacterium]|nr:D-alanyl-D-alanine carboxypeptidase family protein [Kofleriaceae bacterium]